MLSYLRISNFAIIEEVELTLGPGLTVLSGETGAGKSLILDAVALLRGGRATADVIRSGADEARIEALFSPAPESPATQALIDRLHRLGIDPKGIAEDGLVVRRVIGRGGRNRIHIQGQLSTATALAEVCGGLIDVSGQHEHQSLLDVGSHLGLLDRFGVPVQLQTDMEQAFLALLAASEELQAASLDEKSRSEREEFLRFQLQELDQADPQPGEDESLRNEQRRLRSVEKLAQAGRRSESRLYSGEDSVLDGLSAVLRELREVAGLDAELQELTQRIAEAQLLLGDAAHDLRRYVDGLAADPERLVTVEDRLHLLSRLLRKHGPDLASLLQKRDDMQRELLRLTSHEARRLDASQAVEIAQKAACQTAKKLSDARQKAAQALATKVEKELADLAMEGARLVPQVLPRPASRGDDPALVVSVDAGDLRRLGRDGWDRCELLFSANHGEDPRPLQRIASGGELSRVMLALRGVLGQADEVATCVFDEVDSGIGGATADRVGCKIRSLANGKQVLCISHLAQIAAYGQHHFRVEKQVLSGRTVTSVRPLRPTERRDEIARMIGGARLTEKSRAHADELIAHAQLAGVLRRAPQASHPNPSRDSRSRRTLKADARA
ncbi:MAG: DNA repair protein RecN [Polyangia bacterium]